MSHVVVSVGVNRNISKISLQGKAIELQIWYFKLSQLPVVATYLVLTDYHIAACSP